MRYQAPRGTEDVLPTRSHAWLHLESTFRDLATRYAYRELRTPTFEDTDLFVRSSGDTSEIVTKQMYTFFDKGDRSITLKPEGTAPAMRAVLEHNLCPPGNVLRLSYVTAFFRYERPQKGRLREAHQMGLELIGSTSPEADAEIIEMSVRLFGAVGLGETVVLLNSIGREECRAKFREAVLRKAEGYLRDQEPEVRARMEKNPLRLLDSKDPAAKAALEGLEPITDFLEDASRARLDAVQALLTEAKVPYRLAPEVVRGLDYYTESVFEVQSDRIGAQSALCGGGRYDDLIRDLGGPSMPSVGVGIGMERLLLVLEGEGRLPSDRGLDTFVVVATESARSAGRALARELREAGIATTMDFEGRKMGAQMKLADRAGARLALLLGDEELAADTVTIRDLASGDQTSVPLSQAAVAVKERCAQ